MTDGIVRLMIDDEVSCINLCCKLEKVISIPSTEHFIMLLLLFLRIIPLHNFSNDFKTKYNSHSKSKKSENMFRTIIIEQVYFTPKREKTIEKPVSFSKQKTVSFAEKSQVSHAYQTPHPFGCANQTTENTKRETDTCKWEAHDKKYNTRRTEDGPNHIRKKQEIRPIKILQRRGSSCDEVYGD